MAKYNKETKFYWLQLKEDFFEDDAIEWLEEQKPNGRDYAYFYLKLCLKSLKSNGVLIRKVGDILIPYDNAKLAELTKMDFDTVTVAMELLKKIGLIKILENGEIYVNQLEQLIGSKSIGAFKKQQQRLLGGQEADNCPPQSGQEEEKCPPKIEIELEKEIDIDIDIDIEQDVDEDIEQNLNTDERVAKITKCYENNIGMITPATAETLFSYLEDFKDYRIILEAIKRASKANIRNTNYIEGILKSWKYKNYKVLADLEQEQNKKQEKTTEKQKQNYKEIDTSILTDEEYADIVRGKATYEEILKRKGVQNE